MNSVKSIKKISKVTGKLKVLGAVLMCAVMVALVPTQAYADQKFSLRYYATDTDTTLGTKGNLLDNTKLSLLLIAGGMESQLLKQMDIWFAHLEKEIQALNGNL